MSEYSWQVWPRQREKDLGNESCLCVSEEPRQVDVFYSPIDVVAGTGSLETAREAKTKWETK